MREGKHANPISILHPSWIHKPYPDNPRRSQGGAAYLQPLHLLQRSDAGLLADVPRGHAAGRCSTHPAIPASVPWLWGSEVTGWQSLGLSVGREGWG